MNKTFIAIVCSVLFTGCSSMSSLSQLSSLDRLEIQSATDRSQPPEETVVEQVSVNVRLYSAGKLALKEGRVNDAIRSFELALKVKPSDVETLNALAVVYFEQDQAARALDLLEQAEKIDPDNIRIKRNISSIRSFQINNRLAAVRPSEESLDPTAEVVPVEQPPVVLDLQRPFASQPLVGTDRGAVEVLPLQIGGGIQRVLPQGQLVQVNPQVYELVQSDKLIAQVAVVQQTPVQPEPVPEPVRKLVAVRESVERPRIVPAVGPTQRSLSLLVSNGVGKKGLACGQAKSLKTAEAIEVSCGDYQDFKQAQTRLFVREGAKVSAEMLDRLKSVTGSVKIVRVKKLPKNLDLHLVLGKDFSMARVVALRT